MQDTKRRDFLGMALGGVAAVGAVASLYAMKRSWDPLPSVVSAGFTTFDLSALQEGVLQTVEWRGKPVYILKKQAGSQKTPGRDFEIDGAIYTVGIQICTHLGCIPSFNQGAQEFACACHGGRFNSSGVNEAGTPPPRPMDIPPFKIDGTKMVLGEEGQEYKALLETKQA
nr:ubiquinol-cytochrome c reductase iron-sulfur subunit [uncultured Helicobacter sp.]